MRAIAIVYRKELREIARDRRTLIAIGSRRSRRRSFCSSSRRSRPRRRPRPTRSGIRGDVPTGLDILLTATGLKLERVADPAAAARQQVDLGVAFTPRQIDEYYDPTRQSAQIADTRLQTVLGQYNAAKAAAALKAKGVDPGVLNPLPVEPTR